MQYCPNCDNALSITRNTTNDQQKANFKCLNCEYTHPINPRTKIMSRTDGSNNSVNDDTKYRSELYKNMVNDVSVPHTRNYICSNSECISHTDFSKRDAIWFKPELKNYNKIFVCTACNQIL